MVLVPEIELSQRVKGAKQLSVDHIKEFIKKRLVKSCEFKVTSEAQNALVIEGIIPQDLLWRITSFQATFDIRIEGQNGLIIANGKTIGNWLSIIYIIVGVFTLIPLIVCFALYIVQNKQVKAMLESALKAVDTEFSAI